VPVWHGVPLRRSDRKNAVADLQRALLQQAAIARLGELALRDSDPDSLMRAGASLIGEIDASTAPAFWEVGRDGRRLNLRAGLEDEVWRRPPRLRRPRLPRRRRADSGAVALVPDWPSWRKRFTMPAVCAPSALQQLAVMIDRQRTGPLACSTPTPPYRHRFTPKDVPFCRPPPTSLTLRRHAADQALRHRVLHDALQGPVGNQRQRRRSPARRRRGSRGRRRRGGRRPPPRLEAGAKVEAAAVAADLPDAALWTPSISPISEAAARISESGSLSRSASSPSLAIAACWEERPLQVRDRVLAIADVVKDAVPDRHPAVVASRTASSSSQTKRPSRVRIRYSSGAVLAVAEVVHAFHRERAAASRCSRRPRGRV